MCAVNSRFNIYFINEISSCLLQNATREPWVVPTLQRPRCKRRRDRGWVLGESHIGGENGEKITLNISYSTILNDNNRFYIAIFQVYDLLEPLYKIHNYTLYYTIYTITSYLTSNATVINCEPTSSLAFPFLIKNKTLNNLSPLLIFLSRQPPEDPRLSFTSLWCLCKASEALSLSKRSSAALHISISYSARFTSGLDMIITNV